MKFVHEHKYSHSYAVYKKLTKMKEGPLALQVTSEQARDAIIKEVYESNNTLIKDIKKINIDGLIYSIRLLQYENYNLIFVGDDFSSILVNILPSNVGYIPENEKICIWEVPDTWIHTIDPDGFAFKAINTWEPFVIFNKDHNNGIQKKNQNNYFWHDVDNFLFGNPSKGNYEYVQLGFLIIIYSYKKSDTYKVHDKNPYSLIVDNYMSYKNDK